jgi:outer membrane receptor protein involved in Fe transport
MLKLKRSVAITGRVMSFPPRSHSRAAGRHGALPCLVLSLLALAPVGSFQAQQPAPGQPEGMLFGEIPVITGASRFEQSADEAPASVTVITTEEIGRQGWRTLAELLQSVRGLYASNDRNYTYLGVRGFGQPGDYNTRVLLLLDGQRINDNVGGLVLFATESPVELELVDRVEVIRGPGSSLYGTGAFFAVVNVVTRRGRDLRGGEVAAAIQSYGGRQARLSLGTRFRSGLEVLASGTLFRSSGQDFYFPEYDDPATHSGRTVDVDRDRREHSFLKMTRGPVSLIANYSRREKRIPTASYGTIFNDPAAQTTDQSSMIALQYAPAVGRRGQLHTALSYHSYNYDGVYPYPGALNTDFAHGRWWIAEGNYAMRLGRAHQLVLGGEYQRNALQAQGAGDSTAGTVYFYDNTRGDNWGVFAQDEIRLNSRLLANAGLRYDRYPSFGGTLNPRLALIYHHAGSAVKLLAGRAFRAPNSYERFYTDGLTQKPTSGLNPEEIWTVEAVVERQLARRWRISLSGYDNHISNLITLVTDPADSLLVFRNVGGVDAHGLELETEGELGGLNLRASYALQQAKDGATGVELSNSPRHLAKLDASRAFFRERLMLGVEMNALSRRTAANGGGVPGHAVFNLALRTRDWPRGVSAGLGVYNLFDRAYGDPGSEEHLQAAIPQDGRSFRLTLQYGF